MLTDWSMYAQTVQKSRF